MIMIPPPPGDPWDGPMPTNGMDWRERERRQRTVRLLLMFMLMLLLMDSEEQSTRSRQNRSYRLRRQKTKRVTPLEEDLFQARQEQEAQIQQVTRTHPRYRTLIELNENVNHQELVRKWAEEREKENTPEDDDEEVGQESSENLTDADSKDEGSPREKLVFHYPWNTTGFYRGEWQRHVPSDDEDGSSVKDAVEPSKVSESTLYHTAVELETPMKEWLADREERIGVFLLPTHTEVKMPDNFTALNSELPAASVAREALRSQMSNIPKSPWVRMSHPELNVLVEKAEDESPPPELPLKRNSGRAAFQLYSRSIPSMQEMSLIDGFIKLYDSTSAGYSTRRDVLLRVRGVMIHAIGRVSLVSNVSPGRSALVLSENSEESDKQRHRRLQHSLTNIAADPSSQKIEQIRDEILGLYPPDSLNDSQSAVGEISSIDIAAAAADGVSHHADLPFPRKLVDSTNAGRSGVFTSQAFGENKLEAIVKGRMKSDDEDSPEEHTAGITVREDPLGRQENATLVEAQHTQLSKDTSATTEVLATSEMMPLSRNIVPYPFVYDDRYETVRKAKTPASRRMPSREQVLEANAGLCEFEINLDIMEIEWSVEEWRKLVGRHVHETHELNPSLRKSEDDINEDEEPETDHRTSASVRINKRRRRKAVEDAALAMMMAGSIVSPNCDFVSTLNATAIRTDWELTTGKAINYSFYMMLTCLTQIVVLLRQLLHSQSQSAAIRVSLLAVGWQTVLDALLCLAHIYLSLAMQPLFTAFASVAFFKLLVFCVIEMKYMAIIIQARNNSNGGSVTTEVLRRQLAMLHLRFYAAVMAAFFLFFYAGDSYRVIYMLALYSFWVPQIVQNVITESKRPLHHYYVYGMSLTRLVSPLYIFAAPNNFLKEVYPDAPSDVLMCQCLVLWVGIQTAVLVGQSKYGARFMIPARFLPPKFDYSRPIPAFMLPPPESPPPLVDSEHTTEMQTLLPTENSAPSERSSTGTRNRNRRNTTRAESTLMTTEEPVPDHSSACTLDCVICYNAIDVQNRRGYMLAPCDHIFHRECLVQWMDVKMECPICRTELPPL